MDLRVANNRVQNEMHPAWLVPTEWAVREEQISSFQQVVPHRGFLQKSQFRPLDCLGRDRSLSLAPRRDDEFVAVVVVVPPCDEIGMEHFLLHVVLDVVAISSKLVPHCRRRHVEWNVNVSCHLEQLSRTKSNKMSKTRVNFNKVRHL